MIASDYQRIHWYDGAIIPEASNLPLQLPLLDDGSVWDGALRGRSGDLLVIQMRNSDHAKANIQHTLRSLGLKGPRSMSLRDSSQPNVFGYIENARSYIAVVILDEVKWLTATGSLDSKMNYEIHQYGTNTRPASMVRDEVGDYLVYYSDRDGVLLNWSTDLGIADCLAHMRKTFGPLLPMTNEKASALGVHPVDRARRSFPPPDYNSTAQYIGLAHISLDSFAFEPQRSTDEWEESSGSMSTALDELDIPTSEATQIIENRSVRLAYARLGFAGIDLTWREPFTRFYDRDSARAQVGVYSGSLDRDAARRFARLTGPAALLDSARFKIHVRRNGNAQQFEI